MGCGGFFCRSLFGAWALGVQEAFDGLRKACGKGLWGNLWGNLWSCKGLPVRVERLLQTQSL